MVQLAIDESSPGHSPLAAPARAAPRELDATMMTAAAWLFTLARVLKFSSPPPPAKPAAAAGAAAAAAAFEVDPAFLPEALARAPLGWPAPDWSTVPTYTFCGPSNRPFEDRPDELQFFAGANKTRRRPRWYGLGCAPPARGGCRMQADM